MDTTYKEVRFDKYCGTCQHKDIGGSEEPCNSCIARPMMFGTEVPRFYKEAEKPKAARPVRRMKIRRYNGT